MHNDRFVESAVSKRPQKKKAYIILWIFIAIVVILLIAILVLKHIANERRNPIPATIRKELSFTTYYPQTKKLPTGYTLDSSSISVGDQVLVYAIDYGQGQKVLVSEQTKPSDSEIKTFYATHLQTHSNLNTSFGIAAIGTLNNQTFASLPTNSNTWLIITDSLNTDQDQFKKVIQSFTH